MAKKIISIPIDKNRISQLVPHANYSGYSYRIVLPTTAGKFAKHVLLISQMFTVENAYNPEQIIMKFYADKEVRLSVAHKHENGKVYYEQVKTTPEELAREMNVKRYIKTNPIKRFSQDEIEYLKRNVSAIDFLTEHTCHTFTKEGSHYFRCNQNSSFVIDMKNNAVYWNSQNVRGSLIEYLTQVEGKTFQEAILMMKQHLDGLPLEKRNLNLDDYQIDVPFLLPERNPSGRRAVAYLTKTRGIRFDILRPYFSSKDIYEDIKGNVVFVSKNLDGTPVSAFLRSTYGTFKGNVAGSDKTQGFFINCCPGAKKLVITEAFIDGFSYLANKMNLNEPIDFNVLACDSCTVAFETFRLNYLRRPELKENLDTIILAFDNAQAGIKAKEKFMEVAHMWTYIKHTLEDYPEEGLDWNAQMIKNKEQLNELEKSEKTIDIK